MSSSPTTLQNLFTAVKRVADHQAEIKRLKGENFNLFSILGMETAENKTHSAFLGELLNPWGSHGMGSLFLRLFLEEIGCQAHLDLTTAVSVTLEYHIDWTDYDKETGGRIDIYIEDSNRRSVSIENKIYAGDQYRQVARYVNHNKGRNRVYYLTLNGDDASMESRGDNYKAEEHYYCKSYKKDILGWLDKCMKEAADFPILRESIKQYMILIQKLTGQLTEHKMIAELDDLISKNYEAAKLVTANFERVKWTVVTAYLGTIVRIIEQELGKEPGWKVEIFNPGNLYVGLSIRHDSWGVLANSNNLEVRLWSETTIEVDPYFGVMADSRIWNRADLRTQLGMIPSLKDTIKESNGWAHYEYIKELFGPSGLDNLFTATETDKKHLVERIAATLVAFAKACRKPLEKIERLA